jgi:hypothetical protein
VNFDDTASFPEDRFEVTGGFLTAHWDKIPAYVICYKDCIRDGCIDIMITVAGILETQ